MMIRRANGFTLIELLVVISIIGILSALLLTNFVSVRERGQDASVKNDLGQLKTALRLYYNDHQAYPSANGGTMMGCGVNGDSACSLGGSFDNGTTVFMKKLPEDFSYYSDGADQFLLMAALKNASDTDIQNSQAKCAPGSRAYFNGTAGNNDYFVCED